MRPRLTPASLAAAALLASRVVAAQSGDELARSFRAPPDAAKPRVWWHWMNANVTPEGIDQDFAWMRRVGIGRVPNFDGSLDTPRVVAAPRPFLSDGWKAAFRHAVSRADPLGLELTIASSPGWSETGGPWVKPGQAMKKLVRSEREVDNVTAVFALVRAGAVVVGERPRETPSLADDPSEPTRLAGALWGGAPW